MYLTEPIEGMTYLSAPATSVFFVESVADSVKGGTGSESAAAGEDEEASAEGASLDVEVVDVASPSSTVGESEGRLGPGDSTTEPVFFLERAAMSVEGQ